MQTCKYFSTNEHNVDPYVYMDEQWCYKGEAEFFYYNLGIFSQMRMDLFLFYIDFLLFFITDNTLTGLDYTSHTTGVV